MTTLNLFTTSHCRLRKAAMVLLLGFLLITLISCKPEPNPDDDRRVSIRIEKNH
jgi:hypothetical protein